MEKNLNQNTEKIIAMQVLDERGELKAALAMPLSKFQNRIALAICKRQNRCMDCQFCELAQKGQCDLLFAYLLATAVLDDLEGKMKYGKE